MEHTLGSAASGSLGSYPVDCATTHNNNRAAVRYANPSSNAVILSIWELNGTGVPTAPLATIGGTFAGVALKSGEQTNLAANLYGYWPSDRIDLTNTRGVSIGSGFSGFGTTIQDETYIELFSVNGTSPALINQWVITPSSSGNVDGAGYANDVAFTRDGDWAIINSDNWIHAIQMTPPSPATSPVLRSLHIGDIDYSTTPPTTSWNRPCTPNQAVDSVALTNDVAIVTTARINTTTFPGRYTTWVYILDLANLTNNAPTVVLQDEILPTTTEWNPQGDDVDRPHDVELIAFDDVERYGIVTTRHGVAAYDLVNFVRIGRHFGKNDSRRYQRQVDSVEADDGRHAVVIADDNTLGTPRWSVKVFSVSTMGFTLAKTYLPSASTPPTRAHDLAVDTTADKAIVRTTYDNVIVTSLTSAPAAATVLPSPNGSDAYAYETLRSQTSYAVFSSDSVAICPAVNGRVMAATIGAYKDGALKWTGGVDLIDLAAATLTVSQTNIAYDLLSDYGCVPVDLGISTNYSEVVVRSIDTYYSTISIFDSDLVRISLTIPFIVNTRYGGNGTCNGLDSLAAPVRGFVNVPPNKRVLSISQEPLTSIGNDYAHIAN